MGRKSYELRPTEFSHVIEEAITACHLQLAEGGFEIKERSRPICHWSMPMARRSVARYKTCSATR